MRDSKFTPRTPRPAGSATLRTSAMIASLAAEGMPTRKAPFGHALCEAAARDERIIGITADLSKYTDLYVFAERYPDRFYQMGMAEQVMISAAAGMAREGCNVFATTYAVFASRRAYDFICLAIAKESFDASVSGGRTGAESGSLTIMASGSPAAFAKADPVLGAVADEGLSPRRPPRPRRHVQGRSPARSRGAPRRRRRGHGVRGQGRVRPAHTVRDSLPILRSFLDADRPRAPYA